MPKKKVLVVDDEKSLSELIMKALVIMGNYKVERAFNGQEALEKYKSFSPDIVLVLDHYYRGTRRVRMCLIHIYHVQARLFFFLN
jgi:PleD family two-component response regulator